MEGTLHKTNPKHFLKNILGFLNPYFNQATKENAQQQLDDQDQSTDYVIVQNNPNQLLNIPNPGSNDHRENSPEPEVGGEEETRGPVRQRKANMRLSDYDIGSVSSHMWERR